MRLKYTGGRSMMKAHWQRKSYVFKIENDYTVDVPDELGKELLMVGKYEVVPIIIVEKSKPKPPIAPYNEYTIKPVKKGRPKKGVK